MKAEEKIKFYEKISELSGKLNEREDLDAVDRYGYVLALMDIQQYINKMPYE